MSVFPLVHPYKPSLFAAAISELDADARQLATRLGGHREAGGDRRRRPGAPVRARLREQRARLPPADHVRAPRQDASSSSSAGGRGDEPSACGQLEELPAALAALARARARRAVRRRGARGSAARRTPRRARPRSCPRGRTRLLARLRRELVEVGLVLARRITSVSPARCAASTLSRTPPIWSTWPVSVISPVIATSLDTGSPRTSETSAVAIVIPADGPSFGTAPAGTWMWTSWSGTSPARSPSSLGVASHPREGGAAPTPASPRRAVR